MTTQTAVSAKSTFSVDRMCLMVLSPPAANHGSSMPSFSAHIEIRRDHDTYRIRTHRIFKDASAPDNERHEYVAHKKGIGSLHEAIACARELGAHKRKQGWTIFTEHYEPESSAARKDNVMPFPIGMSARLSGAWRTEMSARLYDGLVRENSADALKELHWRMGQKRLSIVRPQP